MTKRIIALWAISFFSIPNLAYSASQGCEAKVKRVEQQINYAKHHGETFRIKGLEKALKEIKDNCTDEQLIEKKVSKIREKEQKVFERTQELNEAKLSGREDKIEKKMEKLLKAKEELIEAENELNNT